MIDNILNINEVENIKQLLTKDELVLIHRIAFGKDDLDDHEELYDKLFQYYVFETGQMPYGTAKARTGDPFDWITDRIGRIQMSIRSNMKRELEKCRFRIKISISSYRRYPDSELLRHSLKSELAEYSKQKRLLMQLDEWVLDVSAEIGGD